MVKNKKSQKSLDEKTADLWLTNTGQDIEKDTETNTEDITEKDTEVNTDKNTEQNTNAHLLLNKDEQYTKRFELKMKPSQMNKLHELSDKYNKSRAEILRTSFEFLLSKLENNE